MCHFHVEETPRSSCTADFSRLTNSTAWTLQNQLHIVFVKMTETRVYMDIAVSNYYIGRVEFELYTMDCPVTCENFRVMCTGERQRSSLYKSDVPLHFKDNCFHRVIKGFMIQAGRFLNDKMESIGESIYGGRFPDENFKHKHSSEGMLSMANSGPNTNSCQFFITLAPTPHLDGNFLTTVILRFRHISFLSLPLTYL